MIGSDRQAVRVGSALLVVDGTDMVVFRKAEFSLSPGRAKARTLVRLVDLSREVYNASVEHRKGAWERAGVSVGRFDEFNDLSDLRRVRPDIVRFGNQVVRGAISRADEAFAGFSAVSVTGRRRGIPGSSRRAGSGPSSTTSLSAGISGVLTGRTRGWRSRGSGSCPCRRRRPGS